MLKFLRHDLYQIFLILYVSIKQTNINFKLGNILGLFTHYQGVQYDNFRTTNHFTIYRLL